LRKKLIRNKDTFQCERIELFPEKSRKIKIRGGKPNLLHVGVKLM